MLRDVDGARGSILAAAVSSIEEGGLADLSMREVARRAGVSHQLPYHYFIDREGILAAIAQAGFMILGARLGKVYATKATGAERLAAAGRVYVEFACEHPAHFRVMYRRDFVSFERHPEVQREADDCFAIVPKLVADAVADGPLAMDEKAVVIVGWSISHGLACLLLDGPLAKRRRDTAGARKATIRSVMDVLKQLAEKR
jgi:AcrR family transcriptional regulator